MKLNPHIESQGKLRARRVPGARLLAGAAGLLLTAVATPGFADELYLGAALGRTGIDESVGDLPIDDEATAFKLGGGYRFSDSFALQLGYSNFGEVSNSDRIGDIQIDRFADLSAVTAAAEFRVPVSDGFALLAKVGMTSWEVDSENFESFPERDGEDLFYGLGASIDIGPNFEVVGEWERFEIGAIKPDVFSLGFNVRL